MSELFQQNMPFDNALIWGIGAIVAVVLILLISTARAAARVASLAQPIMNEMGWMSQRVQSLSKGKSAWQAACTMCQKTKA